MGVEAVLCVARCGWRGSDSVRREREEGVSKHCSMMRETTQLERKEQERREDASTGRPHIAQVNGGNNYNSLKVARCLVIQ